VNDKDLLDKALRQFDENTTETLAERALALEDRRFVFIEGAQWEGAMGEQFENSPRLQINKTQRGHDKIINDYRANRFAVQFRPIGDDGDDDTAELLNGLLQADVYRSKGQLAFDNAFSEGAAGGMGAWRLCNEYEDESDDKNDHQRICIDMIPDADQRVFFDRAAKLYDKSDARHAYVLNSYTPDGFKNEFGEDKAVSWPENTLRPFIFDWFRGDAVWVAEYYEVEHVSRELRIYTREATGEEFRYWAEDMADGQDDDLQTRDFSRRTRKIKRKRVHKWILSGAEVLEDCGYIAGDRIPLVPFYGKRVVIDNIERFKGHVRDAKDPAKAYNAQVSKLIETASLAPREVPIFAPEQVDGLQSHWANMNIQRHPYGLAHPLTNPMTGDIVATGPVAYVKPPDVPPAMAALIQIMGNDIAEITNGDDTSMEIKSNVSGEAMDIAASRVDAHSFIYMDNFKLSMQAFGEIYYGMAKEVYVEEGRKVETMDEDGKTAIATLGETVGDPKTGVVAKRYDLSVGRFNVISDVTEATATRRDKTVRTMMTLAQAATSVQALPLGQAALLTAIDNMDGEGMGKLQDFVHKMSVEIGLDEMTPEEQQTAAQAQQNQQPSPTDQALQAQAADFAASAAEKQSQVKLNEAKTVQTLADAHKKVAESEQITTAPTQLPDANSLMQNAA
jgi:hypothetical protein